MSSSSKKLIASFAAVQILIYHCWMPVFRYGSLAGSVERFAAASAYTGVDIYFFISAFSLVSRPVDDYRGFIRGRAAKLLPLFFIALLGGRFLWFIPSIMIMYLVLPPLHRLCLKNPVLSFPLLLAGWAGLVYLICGVLRPAQDVGIFLFRIPCMILGAYAAKYCKDDPDVRSFWKPGIILLAAGTALVYKFGYLGKLNVPFRGTFYLMGMPFALGAVMVLGSIGSKKIPAFIKRFGSMTLELYFSQMMLGSFLISRLFRMTESRIISNLVSAALIIAVSAGVKKINDAVQHRLNGR